MSKYARRIYDQVADEYDERKMLSALGKMDKALTWERIKNALAKDKRSLILDAGGGTGLWAIPLAQAGYKVVLLDLSFEMLKEAERKIMEAGLIRQVSIIQGDVCHLGMFPEETFGFILAIGDVLSYCDDAEVAVKEFYRVARPDAYIIAEVENRYTVYLSGRRGETWEDIKRNIFEGKAVYPDPQNPFPIRLFTPEEARQIFEQNGWRLECLTGKYISPVLLGSDMAESAASNDQTLKELVEIERHLQADSHLLGSGLSIEITAKK